MTEQDTAGIAYYLYCLTPSGKALSIQKRYNGACRGRIAADSLALGGPLRPCAAIEEAGVFVWVCEGIGAVLGETRREEFCGVGADARMDDLAWIGPRALRHEAVVEHVMRQSPVLPAPFATLFTSLESLRGFILEHRDAITGFFGSLGDKREWAVKGWLDRTLASRRADPEAIGTRHSPGTSYLHKKRADAQAGEHMSEWLRAVCQRAASALEQQASAFRERKLWNGSATDSPAEVILNWAFLVPGGAEADFRRRVNQLDEQHRPSGLSFALSGPWPPYSFAPALGTQAVGPQTVGAETAP